MIDGDTLGELWRVLTLHDYTTRVVVLGTTMLGVAAGTVGTFMLLRKRALMGDALSHASLPGVAAAFIVITLAGGDGKFLPGLLAGAVVTSLLGVGAVLAIRHTTPLKEDAALGIVLSVFFGLGVALLGVVQRMPSGNAAGLESFIYGKTASMLTSDAWLLAAVAAVAAVACALLFKEFTLLCFDQGFAAARGYPVLWLDLVMMALVVAVTVIGLQAVGLILILALLIIPPAAARFWTHRLGAMVVISAVIGAVSGYVGASLSALFARLPAGAVIVVAATALFVLSMVFGRRRGVIVRAVEHARLARRIAHQHLLRAMYEWNEAAATQGRNDNPPVVAISVGELLHTRSWSRRALERVLGRAERAGLVRSDAPGGWRLTDRGVAEARRVTRNHRLWEMYLITHADIAPSHVDRDADAIEHVLGQDMVEKLEALLRERAGFAMLPSPHG